MGGGAHWASGAHRAHSIFFRQERAQAKDKDSLGYSFDENRSRFAAAPRIESLLVDTKSRAAAEAGRLPRPASLVVAGTNQFRW
jgi:hypothetical protein